MNILLCSESSNPIVRVNALIRSEVSLAEILGYANCLRSIWMERERLRRNIRVIHIVIKYN